LVKSPCLSTRYEQNATATAAKQRYNGLVRGGVADDFAGQKFLGKMTTSAMVYHGLYIYIVVQIYSG